jgi:hypothetical protein
VHLPQLRGTEQRIDAHCAVPSRTCARRRSTASASGIS